MRILADRKPRDRGDPVATPELVYVGPDLLDNTRNLIADARWILRSLDVGVR
jgi:hypothetical protein